MRSGDVVVVPDNTSAQASVFGGVMGADAGARGIAQFVNGRLDILQALADQAPESVVRYRYGSAE